VAGHTFGVAASSDADRVLLILGEFVNRLDELYGVYLDATSGFDELVRRQERVDKDAAASPDYKGDAADMFITHGDPNDPKNVMLHRTTVGDFKQRNRRGGSNHVRLAQYLVVLIFHQWEHEARPAIASVLGLPADDVTVPVLGDLRLLRNEILKHKGVITKPTVQRLEVISGFSEGDVIELPNEAMYELVRAVKAGSDVLAHALTGVDPMYRTIWHVQ
jgi:hypothetical protein